MTWKCLFGMALSLKGNLNDWLKITMEKMKFYTEDEMLDKHLGKTGAPHRDAFENEFNTFLIGKAIKEARKNKYAI